MFNAHCIHPRIHFILHRTMSRGAMLCAGMAGWPRSAHTFTLVCTVCPHTLAVLQLLLDTTT